jgi:tetraacyldisaccharide 4'-kinase
VIISKTYIEDIMYGRRRSPVISAILGLLSLVYGLMLLLRHGMFVMGLLRKKKLAHRVISVGNLTLGGTGKTPAVMNIAAVLMDHQSHPAVISRGYGRTDESAILVVSDGKRVCADSRMCGDEPVLIGTKIKGLPVIVGSDRFRAARFVQEQFSIDTVILDDGFQHIRLRRDLDIVLIDAVDPFGTGRLFPAGILREPISALRRAQVVLINGSDRAADLDALKRSIRKHTGAKIFTSRQVPIDLVETISGDVSPLSALRGTNVLAVAGIARPASFISLLQSLGAMVKADLVFPDHYEYRKSDLADFFQCAADAKVSMIVTTEKDAVRLKNLRPEGIWALRIELKVVEKEEWEEVLLKKS